MKKPGLHILYFLTFFYLSGCEGENLPDREYRESNPFPNTGHLIDIDGNQYLTISIGSQEWMASNLKVMHFTNGDPIAYNLTDAQWRNTQLPAIGWADDVQLLHYGVHYNWFSVRDPRGLCPENWRVPTYEDWTILMQYVDGGANSGAKSLKSCRQQMAPLGGDCKTDEHPRWEDAGFQPDVYGIDKYGFSALPAGYRHHGAGYYSYGFYAGWWTASAKDETMAEYIYMYFNDNGIKTTAVEKQAGFSIRCIRDLP